jgi:hypothetical protein
MRAAGIIPWRDEVSIMLGDVWRISLEQSIDQCDRMLVFWCRHSRQSVEVRNEYTLAIDKKKIVVPIRIDRCKLPPELGKYQGADMSSLAWWSHEIARWERIPWIVGVVLILVGSIYGLLI